MATLRLLLFGDSITHASGVVGGGWAARVIADVDELARRSASGHRISGYNLGIGGDTSSGLRLRLRAEAEVRRRDAGAMLVVVAIGINDLTRDNRAGSLEATLERFVDNLAAIAVDIAAVGGTPLLVGPTPVAEDVVDDGDRVGDDYRNAEIASLDAALRASCRSAACASVHPLGACRAAPWDELLDDGLHPGPDGHALLARVIAPAVHAGLRALAPGL